MKLPFKKQATIEPPSSVKPASHTAQADVDSGLWFAMEPDIAHRFNAYAASAYPYEVGGLLRVESDGRGGWLATDIHVFPQSVSPGYFELDGDAVAQFNMNLLKEGRKNELPEWRALIHSHPSMTPQMSRPDRENILRLAGDRFAFSVICSAEPNPYNNEFVVHYAQGKPLPFVVHSLPVIDGSRNYSSIRYRTSADIEDGRIGLRGIGDLDDETLAEIAKEVKTFCSCLDDGSIPQVPDWNKIRETETADKHETSSRHENSLSVSQRFSQALHDPNRSQVITAFDLDDEEDDYDETMRVEALVTDDAEFDCGQLTDCEYSVCDAVLAWAQEKQIISEEIFAELMGCCDASQLIDEDELLIHFHQAFTAASDEGIELDESQETALEVLCEAAYLTIDGRGIHER